MAHLQADRDALLSRVRRIAGQVASIERAIASDAGCADILHQVAGVRGAMGGLMDLLVEEHVREHLARPGLSNLARAKAAEELMAVIRRYAK